MATNSSPSAEDYETDSKIEPKPVTDPIPIPREGQILNDINIGKFDSETVEFDLPVGVSLEIDQKVCLDNGTTRIIGVVKSLGDSKVTVEVDDVFFDGHRIGGV